MGKGQGLPSAPYHPQAQDPTGLAPPVMTNTPPTWQGEPWHGRALGASPSGSLSGQGSARQALLGTFCHLVGAQRSVAFPGSGSPCH